MDIVGRMVSGDLNLLMFLYPDYEVIKEIPLFPSRPAIYVGNYDDLDLFIQTYRDNNLNFIVHNKYQCDIDLDNRFMLLSIIFKKYNRYVPKYVYEMMNILDQDSFIDLCKIFWITGSWNLKELDYENSFLDFVYSLNSSKREMIETYFKVIKDTKTFRIESSLLTFFIRARDKTYKGKSLVYNRMINTYNKNKLDRANRGLRKGLTYHIDNYELKLLNNIMCIIDEK